MSKVLGDALVRVRPDMSEFGDDLEHGASSVAGPAGAVAGSQYSTAFGQKASGRLSSVFKRVAAIGAAVLTGVAAKQAIDFVKESTAGYRDHLKVVALTNQVIKTTGGAANVTARAVGALSDAIERKTGVDGDQIQSSANMLATFTNVRNVVGKGNAIFNQAVRTVTDMSVAIGQDAKSSAVQLGKALNDPIKGVTALQRVGVSFTEKQREQIKTLVESGNTLKAQKIILGELGKEFGGAARAAAQPSERAAAGYRQLQDMVGSVTVPVMNRLYNIFSNKIAPVLLRTGEKYLPSVRKALLGLLDGNNVNAMLIRTGAAFHKIGEVLGRIDLGSVFDKLKGVDTGSANKSLRSLAQSAQKLGPAFADFLHQLPGINNILSVSAVAFGFLANHTTALRRLMPLLVAAFVAYKAAQLAANLAALAALPTKLAELAVNRQLIASNRALLASREAGTVATVEATAVENAGILTRIRSAAATVATAAAQKAAAAASKVWAAGQWVLNAALSANPIGLIVLAIAGLVAAFVIAYKKSDTFRAIVNKTFHGIQTVISAVIGFVVPFVKKHWQLLVSIIGGPLAIIAIQVAKHFGTVKAVAGAAVDFVVGTAKGYARFASAVVSKVGQVVAFFRQLPGKIKGFLTGLPEQLKTIGGQLIDGLKRGIEGAAHLVTDAVQAIINHIPKKIRQLWGINSPAKVAIPLGRALPEGIAVGVEQGSSRAAKAAGKATQKVIDAVKEKLDGARTEFDRLQQQFDSIASTVADAFKGDLFSEKSGSGFVAAAQGVVANLTDAISARTKLLGMGASTNFVTSLFSSGNIDLIRSLVSGPAAIVQKASQLFSQTNQLGEQIGDAIAKNSNFEGKVLGDSMDALRTEVTRLTNQLESLTGKGGNGDDGGGNGGNGGGGGGGGGGKGHHGGHHKRIQIDVHDKSGNPRRTASETARQLAFAGG